MDAVRRARLLLLLLVALGVWPPQLRAQEQDPDPVTVARAFNTTWNTHDADAVLAFFADAPVIRQSSPLLLGYDEGTVTADTYGVAMPISYARIGGGHDSVVLATGRAEVRQWVEHLFAANHRLEAANYQAGGGEVRWTYRAFADPYQRLPAVGPAEGTARAVLHQGKIVALTVTADPASVRRRQGELATAVASGGRQWGVPSPGERSPTSPGPWIAAVIVSLLGVFGLALGKRPPARR